MGWVLHIKEKEMYLPYASQVQETYLLHDSHAEEMYLLCNFHAKEITTALTSQKCISMRNPSSAFLHGLLLQMLLTPT